MKKNIKIVALLALGTISSVQAQKVMNDPSYSIHNYKHPNKAAYVASELAKKPVVYYAEVKEGEEATTEENVVASAGNYKGMKPNKRRQFVAVAPPVWPLFIAPSDNRNYKQQFAPREKGAEIKRQERLETGPVARK